jgi:nucleoside phosphorylase
MTTLPQPEHRPVAIALALEEELRAIRSILREPRAIGTNVGVPILAASIGGVPVRILRSGMGRVRARVSAGALLGCGHPCALLAAGFGGATWNDLATGDVVAAAPLLGPRGRDTVAFSQVLLELATDLPPGDDSPPVAAVPLMTVDAPLATRAQKVRCFAETGARVVDMESWGVALAAAAQNVPFLSLRAIIDDGATDLDPRLLRLVDEEAGRTRRAAAALEILRSPRFLRHALDLRRRSLHAGRSLCATLARVVPEIPARLASCEAALR